MEELPNIEKELKDLLKKILALVDLAILPLTFVALMLLMDFQILSRKNFALFYWIEAVLMNVAIVLPFLLVFRPVRRFEDDWRSSDGEMEKEKLEQHWENLTRLPFRMALLIGGLIAIFMAAGSLVLYATGQYDLRQSLMNSNTAMWFGFFTGAASYAGLKSKLGPLFEIMSSKTPMEWGGRKLGYTAKMIVITLIISVFPMSIIALQVERWTMETVKSIYCDTARDDLKEMAGILGRTWTPLEPIPEFIEKSGRYFVTVPGENDDIGGGVKGWEITLPEYMMEPIFKEGGENSTFAGLHLQLARKLSSEEWKPFTKRLRFTVLLLFLLMSLFSLGMGYAYGRSMSRSMINVTELTRGIARGQAFRYQHLISYSDDEAGDLAIAFNELLRAVQRQFGLTESLLERIRQAVAVLGSSSAQMRSVVDEQAEASHAQAGRVTDIAGTGTEIAAAAQMITEKSTSVKEAAEKTLESCRAGVKRIEDAVKQIAEANRRASEMVERMDSLEERFEKIEKVAGTIAGVSDRTELISLNAALEAAGAKKFGKRFGVVSAEVKRLAVMIGSMTVEIRRHISELREAIHETALATRESAGAVKDGVEGVAKVRENLGILSSTAEQTYTSAIEINVSTREQTMASEKMAETLQEISDLAGQVAVRSEESRKAIEDVSKMALDLTDIIWSADGQEEWEK